MEAIRSCRQWGVKDKGVAIKRSKRTSRIRLNQYRQVLAGMNSVQCPMYDGSGVVQRMEGLLDANRSYSALSRCKHDPCLTMNCFASRVVSPNVWVSLLCREKSSAPRQASTRRPGHATTVLECLCDMNEYDHRDGATHTDPSERI